MTQRLDAYLIAVSGEDERFVLRLAHDLRDQGARIEYGLRASAVRKQLETAAAHGARYAVLVGPAERQSGAAKVRNMATGDEEVVAVSSLLDRIRV